MDSGYSMYDLVTPLPEHKKPKLCRSCLSIYVDQHIINNLTSMSCFSIVISALNFVLLFVGNSNSWYANNETTFNDVVLLLFVFTLSLPVAVTPLVIAQSNFSWDIMSLLLLRSSERAYILDQDKKENINKTSCWCFLQSFLPARYYVVGGKHTNQD